MLTDTEIRTTGFRDWWRHSVTFRPKFITLIRREPFDYTQWHRTLWPDKTVDEISQAAMKQRQAAGQ